MQPDSLDWNPALSFQSVAAQNTFVNYYARTKLGLEPGTEGTAVTWLRVQRLNKHASSSLYSVNLLVIRFVTDSSHSSCADPSDCSQG